MSPAEFGKGLDKKQAQKEIERLNEALKTAASDLASVKANVESLLGNLYAKFPQLKPDIHPRLAELTGKYDALMAKAGAARGDIITEVMYAIGAGVVEHHKSLGTEWRDDPLFQRISSDLSEARIVKGAGTRGDVDNRIDRALKRVAQIIP